jgi:hypothetical protein
MLRCSVGVSDESGRRVSGVLGSGVGAGSAVSQCLEREIGEWERRAAAAAKECERATEEAAKLSTAPITCSCLVFARGL